MCSDLLCYVKETTWKNKKQKQKNPKLWHFFLVFVRGRGYDAGVVHIDDGPSCVCEV